METFFRKKTIRLIPLVILVCFSCKEKGAKPAPRPNIVIILADDLGYGDPGSYNPESKIPTPHIDALAQKGMRFTDAHTPSSVCTPTRYGLLTGRYAWRTELRRGVLWSWDKPLIAKDQVTLPKMLRNIGYATACIGKWHLGWHWPSRQEGYVNDTLTQGDYNSIGRNELDGYIDFSKPLGGGPLEAGFDYYFGDDVPNFPPYVFIENDKLRQLPDLIKPDSMFGSPGPMAKGWRLERVMPKITDRAVSYVERKSREDKPFFLYFALTAPHTPIAPSKDFQGKSEAGLYGDYVNQVDWSVGQIVSALKKAGQLDNTLLIFTSDNGSPQRDGTGMSGSIGSIKKYGHDPSRPWKGMKGDIWEGGHRVPFIVSWPGHVPENRTSDQLICLTDISASISSILKLDVAGEAMEDSFDISSLFFGKGETVRQDIVHHSLHGTFAIREGDWKLILGKDSGGFSRGLQIEGIPVAAAGQLYKLSEDPSEKNNLYTQLPEKVTELTRLLNTYKTEGHSAK